MNITIYRITGRQGKVHVPDWVCRECDMTVAAVRAACDQAGIPQEQIEVVPWLPHIRAAFSEGAYHPPVVLIDGGVYSQGEVPDIDRLAERLREARGRPYGKGPHDDPSRHQA